MQRLPRYDWIVVGSGLTGATFARRLAERSNAQVLVVDRRPHIAGDVYDTVEEDGVRIQRYGAHIFHTSSRAIVGFLSRFTDWYPYQHRVLASVDDLYVPLPFNFSALEMLLPAHAQQLQRDLLAEFPSGARVGVAQLIRSSNSRVRELGEFIVERILRGYTAKQCGHAIEADDRPVLERAPVTLSHDDRYFRDDFQAIPRGGYTAMVSNILEHPSITVALGVDGADELRQRQGARVLWTGQIDSYFDYEFGPLPYRSLRFENSSSPRWHDLPVAVVNHPGDQPFSRIVDHSYFASRPTDGTVLTHEYPAAYRPGQNEPFFPVLDAESRRVHDRYTERAAATDVLFAGRLAEFRYYDMHEAVGRAATVADAVLQRKV
jgi:UDP-galactopyranose mutase